MNPKFATWQTGDVDTNLRSSDHHTSEYHLVITLALLTTLTSYSLKTRLKFKRA